METVSTMQTKKYRQLIAGEWVTAATEATFEDMNPYDNTVFAHIPASSEADAQRAIDAAAKAFPAWAAMG
ncbi:aldehyde dehydrogenase family protein, partial [uncultured Caballeronia sp.]|uniref:aldehyde dehydrogenase family protein n=1 Tax=uncultured Caballeronia sp. TaxID=1827198 RepID=UPI0035CBE121